MGAAQKVRLHMRSRAPCSLDTRRRCRGGISTDFCQVAVAGTRDHPQSLMIFDSDPNFRPNFLLMSRGGSTKATRWKRDQPAAVPVYHYFVSFDLHEVSFDKKGGCPWIYTPVQPRCPSWTSFWPPSRCASVARRARPPWSAT